MDIAELRIKPIKQVGFRFSKW